MKRPTPSRLFLIFAVMWMAAMTWRLYPQFKDAIRVDGRLTSVGQFLEDSCAQRVGPGAATCLAESGEQAQLLLRREQGKSVLIIIVPLLGYLLVYGSAWLFRARFPLRGHG